MAKTEVIAASQYDTILKGCPPVFSLPMDPPSAEEKKLQEALDTLKLVREKYDFFAISRTVKVLQEASRLQNVAPEMKGKTLQELRKMKLIRELVEFDWLENSQVQVIES